MFEPPSHLNQLSKEASPQRLTIKIDESLEVTVHLKRELSSLDETGETITRVDASPAFQERALTEAVLETISPSELFEQTLSPDELTEVSPAWVNAEHLELGATLGEGGMGVIYSAYQRSLEREVAVKLLKRPSPELAQELISEARVMGRLTHPNIPPVHLLRQGEGGQPEVVMKRVEGQTMLAWLNHQAQRGERLREALKVIIQVCYAVEFAHSQGVIHRDIKAENIMLGRFHEVYLMDWGLALDLHKLGDVPQGVVGTPAYMAPEMLYGDPKRLTKQTDVYLLGALLHHALTGRPRHYGERTIEGCLRLAFKSSPAQYEPSVPRALAQLCNDACQREPSARFASVEAFRRALENFLERWSALELLEQARAFKGAYERALSEREVNGAVIDDQQSWQRGYKAKYAFEQTLYLAPTLQEAQEERTQLLTLMIKQAIVQRELLLARSLVRELTEQRARALFEADLNEMIEREAERQARLRVLERELDPRLTREPRQLLAKIILGASLFAIIAGYVWLSFNGFELTPRHGFWVGVFGATPTLIAIIALRARLFVNELGRQATRLVAMILISLVAHRYLSWQLGEDTRSMMISDLLLIGLGFSFGEPALKGGPLIGALGLVCAFLTYLTPPLYGPLLINLYVMTVGMYILWMWGWRTRQTKGAP